MTDVLQAISSRCGVARHLGVVLCSFKGLTGLDFRRAKPTISYDLYQPVASHGLLFPIAPPRFTRSIPGPGQVWTFARTTLLLCADLKMSECPDATPPFIFMKAQARPG